MKRKASFLSSLALLSIVVVSSGCDMLDMPKTTEEMNKTTHDMSQSTQDLKATSNNMDDKMGRLLDATDLQKAGQGLTWLFDKEYTRNLTPVPFKMIPGADLFAKNSNKKDLLNWFQLQFLNLNEVQPNTDDLAKMSVRVPVLAPKQDATGQKVLEVQYKVKSVSGKKMALPAYQWVLPASFVFQFNHDKDVVLNAMEAVAALIPQKMIERMVREELDQHGVYEQTVYQILNFRDAFTRAALLRGKAYKSSPKNLQEIVSEKEGQEGALTFVRNLDYIAHLPYATQIGSTQLKGYLDISENYIYASQAYENVFEAKELPMVAITTGSTSDYQHVTFDYNANATINNSSYQSLYDLNGMVVTPKDQTALRQSGLHFDPKGIPGDWQELETYVRALPPEVLNTKDAQDLLSDIHAHSL